MKIYNKQLDGLRGVAILWVAAYHLFACAGIHDAFSKVTIIKELLRIGWIGVIIFFTLSGYLITCNLIEAKGQPRFFRNFFAKRTGRIIPLYVLLLSTFVVGAIFWHSDRAANLFSNSIPLWSHFLFLQNIFIAQMSYIDSGWLGVTWSLAVEVQYYCFIVIVVWFVQKQRLPFVLLLIIIMATGLRFWFLQQPNNQMAVVNLMPCRMDSFALGGLVACFRQHAKSKQHFLFTAFSGLIGLTLFLLYWRGYYGQYTKLLTPLYYTFISIACASVVSIASNHGRLTMPLGTPVLVNIGRTSYFIYLFHLPIAYICYEVFIQRRPAGDTNVGLALAVLSFILCWLLANISLKYLETPISSFTARRLS